MLIFEKELGNDNGDDDEIALSKSAFARHGIRLTESADDETKYET
jgi:hypothetical protein